mgnify:CR=1 FL=1
MRISAAQKEGEGAAGVRKVKEMWTTRQSRTTWQINSMKEQRMMNNSGNERIMQRSNSHQSTKSSLRIQIIMN